MKDKVCSVSLLGVVHLGSKKSKPLKEIRIKEVKKRRKTLRPVSDHRSQVYVVGTPGATFGVTVFYNPKPGSEYPQIVLCELKIDGRHAQQWILHTGTRRTAATAFHFFTEQDENNNGDQTSQSAAKCFGTVEIIFWRVMSPYSSNTCPDAILPDDEYVPDEGLPAVSVFTYFYRDVNWLLDNDVLTPEAAAKSNGENTLLTSENTYQSLLHNQELWTNHAGREIENVFKQRFHTEGVSNQNGLHGRKRITVEMGSKRGFISQDVNSSPSIRKLAVCRLLKHWDISQSDSVDFELLLSGGEIMCSSAMVDLPSLKAIRIINLKDS